MHSMFRLDLNLEDAMKRAGEPIDAAQWEVKSDDEANEITDLQKRQIEMVSAWKSAGEDIGPTLNKELTAFFGKLFRNKFLSWLVSNLEFLNAEEVIMLKNSIYELILNAIDHKNDNPSFVLSGYKAENGILLAVSESERDFDPKEYVLSKKGWFYYQEEGNPSQAGRGFQMISESKTFYVFFDKPHGVYLTGVYIPFNIKDDLLKQSQIRRQLMMGNDSAYLKIADAVGFEFEDRNWPDLSEEIKEEIRILVVEKRPDLLQAYEKILKNFDLLHDSRMSLYSDPTFLYEKI